MGLEELSTPAFSEHVSVPLVRQIRAEHDDSRNGAAKLGIVKDPPQFQDRVDVQVKLLEQFSPHRAGWTLTATNPSAE
jgi:hypothetical protein